jgi:putative transcriptional regulator
MGKIISKAQQVRLEYQARLGRPVTIQEVADALGVDRRVVARIEQGRMERIDIDTLQKLCAFYGVDVGDLLEYDPNKLQPSFEEDAELEAALV